MKKTIRTRKKIGLLLLFTVIFAIIVLTILFFSVYFSEKLDKNILIAQKAEITDEVRDTVDYSQVYALIKEQMSIPSHLLEHVGRRIINAVKEKFKEITEVKLKISKLNPPVGGQMDCVSVILKG